MRHTQAKRFFWIRTDLRGAWIAAQAAYSDPAAGFYVPGVARLIIATEIGLEIRAPS